MPLHLFAPFSGQVRSDQVRPSYICHHPSVLLSAVAFSGFIAVSPSPLPPLSGVCHQAPSNIICRARLSLPFAVYTGRFAICLRRRHLCTIRLVFTTSVSSAVCPSACRRLPVTAAAVVTSTPTVSHLFITNLADIAAVNHLFAVSPVAAVPLPSSCHHRTHICLRWRYHLDLSHLITIVICRRRLSGRHSSVCRRFVLPPLHCHCNYGTICHLSLTQHHCHHLPLPLHCRLFAVCRRSSAISSSLAAICRRSCCCRLSVICRHI